MAKSLNINGPAKLHGSVEIQGAKNAAMKYVLLPLLTNGIFQFHNIPDISSTRKLAEITSLLGGKIDWQNGRVAVDTTGVVKQKPIPADLFYHTSGAIFAIPIVASRFGTCEVKLDPSRNDTGGDLIGSRNMGLVIKTLAECGIEYTIENDCSAFKFKSDKPFELNVSERSFGASVNGILAALFKSGKSTLHAPSTTAEFLDIVKFLKRAGAKIVSNDDTLEIVGGEPLRGVEWTNLTDKNDFATWVFAAVAAKSKITLTNLSPQSEMGIEPLIELLNFWNIQINFVNTEATIDLSKMNLKPVDVVAGNPPLFHTDWQPLLAAVMTQIDGESTIVDTVFDNRMQYWKQLGQMGAKYEFFSDPKYPEKNGNPRAVKVFGPAKLHGERLSATDVRAGAAFAIAGLVAEGTTQISGVEHIDRGYENFELRLRRLGVKC